MNEASSHHAGRADDAGLDIAAADIVPRGFAAVEPAGRPPMPWEEIDAGRFMPRRICGSFRGRALG